MATGRIVNPLPPPFAAQLYSCVLSCFAAGCQEPYKLAVPMVLTGRLGWLSAYYGSGKAKDRSNNTFLSKLRSNVQRHY